MLYCFFFFFFSSRRRHTRLVSDWSSDVCSSDLVGKIYEEFAPLLRKEGKLTAEEMMMMRTHVTRSAQLVATRSEEHTSELQSLTNLVCRLLLEKKKKKQIQKKTTQRKTYTTRTT